MYCFALQDECRTQKFMDIVSAVVLQVRIRCSCNFTETNIQNYEFSCRGIENTVVFRAEIIYTSLQQARYRADSLVTLVSAWTQSETSIVVDSTRLDVDPTCPTQLGSFQDDDCVLIMTDTTRPVTVPTKIATNEIEPTGTISTSADTTGTISTSAYTSGTDRTGTVAENVAIVGALGGVLGVVCVLLIICSIFATVFVVQRKRKQTTSRYMYILFKNCVCLSLVSSGIPK